MRLSVNTGCLSERFGIEKTVDLLIAAGFDALDFTFSEFGYESFPTSKEYYVNLRKYAEFREVYFNQSHAPAPSSFQDEEKTKRMFDVIVSCMKRASYLGVETIVVHPCQHIAYIDKQAPERLFEYNMKYYRSLIPYCEEYNICVALENMWQYPGMISHSTCSKPQEFVRYLDELNSEYIVGCLDIGHAMLVREMPHEFIKTLGNERLRCLHIHDVDGIQDLHALPYFGITNWEHVMEALAEVDYSGDLTFEIGSVLNNLPVTLVPQYLKLMEQTGRYLIQRFANCRK